MPGLVDNCFAAGYDAGIIEKENAPKFLKGRKSKNKGKPASGGRPRAFFP